MTRRRSPFHNPVAAWECLPDDVARLIVACVADIETLAALRLLNRRTRDLTNESVAARLTSLEDALNGAGESDVATQKVRALLLAWGASASAVRVLCKQMSNTGLPNYFGKPPSYARSCFFGGTVSLNHNFKTLRAFSSGACELGCQRPRADLRLVATDTHKNADNNRTHVIYACLQCIRRCCASTEQISDALSGERRALSGVRAAVDAYARSRSVTTTAQRRTLENTIFPSLPHERSFYYVAALIRPDARAAVPRVATFEAAISAERAEVALVAREIKHQESQMRRERDASQRECCRHATQQLDAYLGHWAAQEPTKFAVAASTEREVAKWCPAFREYFRGEILRNLRRCSPLHGHVALPPGMHALDFDDGELAAVAQSLQMLATLPLFHASRDAIAWVAGLHLETFSSPPRGHVSAAQYYRGDDIFRCYGTNEDIASAFVSGHRKFYHAEITAAWRARWKRSAVDAAAFFDGIGEARVQDGEGYVRVASWNPHCDILVDLAELVDRYRLRAVLKCRFDKVLRNAGVASLDRIASHRDAAHLVRIFNALVRTAAHRGLALTILGITPARAAAEIQRYRARGARSQN